jgi:rhodanese-related sulfurtransferase
MTSPDTPIEIDVHAVRALREAGEPFLLLDCREPEEHATASIAGAVLIPMAEIPDRLEQLEAHRSGLVVVHCHHGVRSLRVVRWLRARGFPGARSMTGGIDAWSQEIDPGTPGY